MLRRNGLQRHAGKQQREPGTNRDSAGRSVSSREATPGAKLPPNHMGAFPCSSTTSSAATKNAMYTRTAESFKADLEDVYKRGYRPITIAQMLDKNFSDVPDGMSPVVFVFDDASPEQFRYVEQNGQLDDRSDERHGHLARLREDPSGLEEPRDVLHAERRRGWPQLLRRRHEVPGPEEGVAFPESEMARRPGLRAVRPHALAREAQTSIRTPSCRSRSRAT